MKHNTISFDFDGTLNDHFGGDKVPYKKETRDWVKRLIRRGYDVHIITRRYGPENSNLGKTNEHLLVWEIAAELGVSQNKIIFTNREWKYPFIEVVGSCIHIDDDLSEKYWLDRHLPDVKMICVEKASWEKELIAEIETHDPFKIWFSSEHNLFKVGVIVALSLLTVFLLV